MRSRADILPSLCWRSRRSRPPPSCASWSRRFISCNFCSRFMGGDYKARPFALAQGRLRRLDVVVRQPLADALSKLDRAFFSSHAYIDQGEVRTFVLRIDGDDV